MINRWRRWRGRRRGRWRGRRHRGAGAESQDLHRPRRVGRERPRRRVAASNDDKVVGSRGRKRRHGVRARRGEAQRKRRKGAVVDVHDVDVAQRLLRVGQAATDVVAALLRFRKHKSSHNNETTHDEKDVRRRDDKGHVRANRARQRDRRADAGRANRFDRIDGSQLIIARLTRFANAANNVNDLSIGRRDANTSIVSVWID